MASYNGNSHLITITAIAIDEDGDNLTYKLYWGTSSSNLSIKILHLLQVASKSLSQNKLV